MIGGRERRTVFHHNIPKFMSQFTILCTVMCTMIQLLHAMDAAWNARTNALDITVSSYMEANHGEIVGVGVGVKRRRRVCHACELKSRITSSLHHLHKYNADKSESPLVSPLQTVRFDMMIGGRCDVSSRSRSSTRRL